jgi:pyruvate dehydrogenase (quinone)/pyruvate decarboxylase
MDLQNRRDLFRTTGVVGLGLFASRTVLPATENAQSPVSATRVVPQPDPQSVPPDRTTADIIVETLITWQVPVIFGMVGDGIGPLIEAISVRQDKIRYIGVRHEEAAAFMACGYAKHTGRLGACIATTGPGAIHLLNGLYDAKMDSAPVLAITGLTFHDLIDTRFMQDVNTVDLMKGVAVYNTAVTSPLHALVVTDIACRAALGQRGVAHITVPKDVQAMKLSADKPSMEYHGLRTSSSWLPVMPIPPSEQIRRAADVLNAGMRVAILAGQGALAARAEVTQVADMLAAPVAKALLGKAVLPDDSPYTTGGIGHLGTVPSEQAMHECDTVLILGSTMPWIDFYPRAGQARGVQIDLNPDRIGLRYPVEVGLVGDVKATLQVLLPLLRPKQDRGFLTTAQNRMRDWNNLVHRVATGTTDKVPMRPQTAIAALGDALAPDAMISLDCGANTHFAARVLMLKEGQRFTGTGLLATMAPGLSYAIAAALAYPGRQSVAIVGDGGFAMLMAELTTAVQQRLPVKVMILKNNTLGEVRFEQTDLGYQPFGIQLGPIDFVAFAKACGADGFHVGTPADLRPAIDAALRTPGPAVIEVVVDPEEKPTLPAELRA